jgi:hypothetical protein
MVTRFVAIVTVVLLLAPLTLVAQSRLHPDYTQGYAQWTAGEYANASKTLARYRITTNFAQTYDVDYWLGTSWCRLAGEEKYGVDLLDWNYRFVQMPAPVREHYKAERDLCQRFLAQRDLARSTPRVIVASALASATARAEGKVFYMPGADKGALSAAPLRVKRQIAPETYDGRLVALADPGRAVSGVKVLAPSYQVVAQGRFVLASKSAHTSDQLRLIARRLQHFIDFLTAEYGLSLPDKFITVYLVPNSGELRALADRVHGLDASPLTLGYALQNDLSVVGVLTTTAAGTLLHELFHLAVRSTYGAIPQWLDEGLASLYETSTVDGERYFGEPNWRGKVVEALRQMFPQVGLRTVILAPWFPEQGQRYEPSPGERVLYPDEQAYVLALARYFVMYLQEHGLLRAVFQAYRDRQAPAEYVPAEVQAVQLLERVVGKPLAEIDSNFRAWYPSVLDPNKRLHLGKVEPKEIPKELGPSVDREAAPRGPN